MQLHLIYYTEDVALLVLAIFYWLISSKGKKSILAEFRKLAKSLRVWIIFAIKAIRISINLLDIRRVVIYIILEPKLYFYPLLQHGSRAGYNSKKAEVIFLFKY